MLQVERETATVSSKGCRLQALVVVVDRHTSQHVTILFFFCCGKVSPGCAAFMLKALTTLQIASLCLICGFHAKIVYICSPNRPVQNEQPSLCNVALFL